MIRWLYSQFFCCKRRIQTLFGWDTDPIDRVSRLSVVDRPWMWIGGYGVSGKLVDITEDINEVACYGELIDHQFLQMISEMTDIEQWMYIDAKTLEQKNFPTEGFIIHKHGPHTD